MSWSRTTTTQRQTLYTAQPESETDTLIAKFFPRLTFGEAIPSSPNTSYTMSPPDATTCLTDTDITRRNLAASGLNVSAPEFVPSFVATSVISGTPCTPAFTSPSQTEVADNLDTDVTVSPVLSVHDALHTLSPDSLQSRMAPIHPLSPPDEYAPPPPLPQPDVYSNVTALLSETPLLSLGTPPTPSIITTRPPLLSSSPYPSSSSHSIPAFTSAEPGRTARAVNSFDEHFPALGSLRPQPDDSDKQNKDGSKGELVDTSKPVDVILAPKALAWDLLQEELAEKARKADADRHLDMLSAKLAQKDTVWGDGSDSPDWDDPHTSTASLTTGLNSALAHTPVMGVHGVHGISADIGSVWVPTGQSVGALYEALRSEAAEQACIRNKYYDRAAAAFKKGDGASAKKLSALAKEANERMKELHRKAADAIFEARNPPCSTDVIDLHGLHVAEALERLPIALQKAESGKVRVVTGSGHHTRGTGRARLRPAVNKWLQENGFYFEEIVDVNDYVGSFVVDLDKR